MKPTWFLTALAVVLSVLITLKLSKDRVVYIPSPVTEAMVKNNTILTEQIKSCQGALNELRKENTRLSEELKKKPKVKWRTKVVRDTIIPEVYEWTWGDLQLLDSRVDTTVNWWWGEE
jgi:uncharacterized membrane protein YqiK